MSTQTGNQAEEVAAQYLAQLGYEILSRNWRTRVCEIDIVAKLHSVIHFVEVKYRRNDHHGSGFDYITPSKLKQMKFAAECWVEENNYKGDYELSAIEVTAGFEVSDFIAELS